MNDKKVILITGATGKQGGAVVRHLLGSEFTLRAVVRNPEKPAAQALQAQGIQLVQGNLEDAASLQPALQGVYGVFSVQNFWEKGTGYEGEIRQARNLAQAANQANVKHFVQSSIAGCDNARGVEHFEVKWEIEKLINSLQLPRTFIRTVFFMENFTDPQFGKLMMPVLSGSLKPETRLHMLASDDIGWFAAEAFNHPDQYLGQTIDVAGDSLAVAEMKTIYQRATGREPNRFKFPAWLFSFMNAEMARQFHWNNTTGWQFDINELRQKHPKLIDFETFVKTHTLP